VGLVEGVRHVTMSGDTKEFRYAVEALRNILTHRHLSNNEEFKTKLQEQITLAQMDKEELDFLDHLAPDNKYTPPPDPRKLPSEGVWPYLCTFAAGLVYGSLRWIHAASKLVLHLLIISSKRYHHLFRRKRC
jgi:hypothetical protein